MPRVCIGCGKEVADAAFCPYCSQPTAERPAAPALVSGGALQFFRVISVLLMLLGLLHFGVNLVWFFVSDFKPLLGVGGGGSWLVILLQLLYPPVLMFALGAILWVLVEIAARLSVPKSSARPAEPKGG